MATAHCDEQDFYPGSDGKPMAETELHFDLMAYAIPSLERVFADRADVRVAGGDFIYYEEGNPKARISPDTYVVFGVPKRKRDSYMVWKEGGKLPDVIIEFTSRYRRREDTHRKRPLYEKWQVPEYFLFDPRGDYLKPRLQGFRLQGDQYVALLPIEGRLHSEQLGLDLVEEEEWLRLYDPQHDEWLLTYGEYAERAKAAEARRMEAEARFAEATARLEAATVRRTKALERLATAEARRTDAEERQIAAEAEVLCRRNENS